MNRNYLDLVGSINFYQRKAEGKLDLFVCIQSY